MVLVVLETHYRNIFKKLLSKLFKFKYVGKLSIFLMQKQRADSKNVSNISSLLYNNLIKKYNIFDLQFFCEKY